MGFFRPSREVDERGRATLPHRMTIFAIGAIIALAGIASGTDWIIYIAVGVLAVGIVLRLLHKR